MHKYTISLESVKTKMITSDVFLIKMMYCMRNIPQKKSIDFRGFKQFPYIIAHKICILKVIQKAIYIVFVAFQIKLQSAILISGNTACKRQYNQDQSYKIEEKN